jgi:hypothetical protein
MAFYLLQVNSYILYQYIRIKQILSWNYRYNAKNIE